MIAGPLRLPISVTLAIALAAGGWSAWSSAEAERKMAPVQRSSPAQGRVNLVITLKFSPEAFHLARAQEIGQVVNVDGTHLFLRSADRALALEYAKAPWVERVDPWNGL